MNKQELLESIKQLSHDNQLSRDELIAAYEEGQGMSTITTPSGRRFALTDILYYLGGVIVALGLIVLIAQNWSYLTTATQLLVTLGAGIAAYSIGVLFSQGQHESRLANPFFLISGLILPLGIGIAFHKAGYNTSTSLNQSLIALLLFAVYAASTFFFRKTIFTIFTFIFGTFLFFSFTSYLAVGSPFLLEWNFWPYRILAVGASYLLLGHYLSHTTQRRLSGVLYSLGSLAFFGAALWLGGWKPEQNMLWEGLFPLLVCGGIGLSIYLKSRSILIFSSLFLVGYILKITSEYFSDTIGWSVSLVIVGLSLIFTGYLTFYLNKKYLSLTATQNT